MKKNLIAVTVFTSLAAGFSLVNGGPREKVCVVHQGLAIEVPVPAAEVHISHGDSFCVMYRTK